MYCNFSIQLFHNKNIKVRKVFVNRTDLSIKITDTSTNFFHDYLFSLSGEDTTQIIYVKEIVYILFPPVSSLS